MKSCLLWVGMSCYAKEYRFPLGENNQYLRFYAIHSEPNEDGIGIDIYDTRRHSGSAIELINITDLQVEGKNHSLTMRVGSNFKDYYLYKSDTIYIKRDDVLVCTLYWHIKNPLEFFSLSFVSDDGEKIEVTSSGLDNEYKQFYYNRADTINIPADYLENRIFHLQAFNLKAGEPLECSFLKYSILVNNKEVYSYSEGYNPPFPDHALREGDTVMIVHACCPAECFTSAIMAIESAVMIVQDIVTAIHPADISEHFFLLHDNRISFTSMTDKVWLYSSSGQLIYQGENSNGFSTTGFSTGLYLMVVSVDNKLVKRKIKIQQL